MSADLIKALREADIIPEVIPEDQSGEIKDGLKVVFPNVTISRGEQPARADVKDGPPEIEYSEAVPSASYTIICVDPDLLFKGEQYAGPVRHWLQSGVLFDPKTKRAAHTLGVANVTNWMGPSPSPDFRPHRYVFIVARESPTYQAKGGKNYPVDGDSDLKGRMQWNAAEYCKEEKLTIEGVAWMTVVADLPAIVDNMKLTAESVINKVMGK